jgi:acetoin utilization deacetylase AcuC-like enzyme
MTLLYSSATLLEHDTGYHPENAGRLVPISRRLLKDAAHLDLVRPTWQPIARAALGRVHSPDYIDSVQTMAAAGGGYLEPDTVVSSRSFEAALLAAGAVTDAVARVVRGEDRQAFCLIRPPGHHALGCRAMGFCLFNNVALGARAALDEFGLDRVLIVDWDVHHGNGTQAMFWEDPQVGFFSIHRHPFYPGTGGADESGAGRGQGTTLNLPVAYGTPRKAYLGQFTAALERFADRIKPQLVLISAGFDAHRDDPIGSLGLESEDFEPLTRVVCDIASAHAGGRLVSVLEGGYNPQALADCVEIHLHALGASQAGATE